jgi:hypothetical protein
MMDVWPRGLNFNTPPPPPTAVKSGAGGRRPTRRNLEKKTIVNVVIKH